MTDRPVQQTRQNNPRIGQIEAEIGRLTSELVGLVGIEDDDYLDTYEDVREAGPGGLDDLAVCKSKLDTLEYMVEEEEGQ